MRESNGGPRHPRGEAQDIRTLNGYSAHRL
jgi:hypothetical protein